MLTKLLLFTLFGIIYGSPAPQGDGLCEVCHLLVGEIQDLLTTGQTQDVITAYVTDVCNKLETEEKDVCKFFFKENSPILFQKLVADLTPHEVCLQLTDVCPATVVEKEPVETPTEQAEDPGANILECELCKLAVLGIDKLIKENRSSAAINSTLEKFCNGLPSPLNSLCQQIEPEILKGLTTGFDPEVACKFARLCDGTEYENVPGLTCDTCYTVMDAIGIQDTESICASERACEAETGEERQQYEEIHQEVQDTLECQICKFAVNAIDDLLGENRTAAAINSTLMKLCDSLPGELKDTCLNVEPDILKAVLGGIDPSKACDFLKICHDGMSSALNTDFVPCDVCKGALEAVAGERGVQLCYTMDLCAPEKPVEAEKMIETPSCELCQFLVKSVNDLVQNDRSRDNVLDALNNLCEQLPEQAQQFCLNQRENIVNYVSEGVNNPKHTCAQFNVCEEHDKELFAPDEEERKHVQEDARCELCKFVLELLNQYVEKNDSMDKINSTLYGICNALPKNYQATCFGIVPFISSAVAQGLDPTNSCLAIKFCTGTSRLITLEEVKCETCANLVEGLPDEAAIKVKSTVCKTVCHGRNRRSTELEQEISILSKVKDIVKTANVKGIAECELCHLLIRTIDNFFLENRTEQEVNRTVYEVCQNLTGRQLVDVCLQDAPKLVEILKKGIDPIKTCIAVKLCNESETLDSATTNNTMIHETALETQKESTLMKALEVRHRQKVGDLKCDICEEVIKFLDSYIEKNASIEKINETLYRLCSGLPSGALQDICLQEIPAIMKVIEAGGLDPDKACKAAKLCPTLEFVTRMKSRKVLKHMMKRANNAATTTASQNVGDLKCDICEEVIKFLDSYIEKNASIEKINETLYRLCSGLPSGAIQDLCLQEIPAIIKAIEAGGLDPDKACKAAKLCSTQEVKKSEDVVRQFKDARLALNEDGNLKDLKCDICKSIIEELDTIVGKNASIEKINETIYKLCNKLPGSLKDLCLYVAPQVVKAIDSGVDPSEICSKIGICKSEEPALLRVNDIKCEICELIIQGLDELVGKNASAAKINETIYKLCDQLPGASKTFCILVAPTVVKEVESGVDPQKACTQLKLCTSTEMPKEVDDIKCEICELIIQGLDELVGKNASAAKINETIYKLCDQLPGAAKTFCILVAPTVVKEVESGVDPQKACTQLKLCTSTEMFKEVNDIKCEICELIIQGLDELVGKNASAAKINETIYKLCDQLPGAAKTFCILVAPTVVKEVESGVDPQKACTQLKLCTSTEIQDEVNDIKCEICELIIQGLDELVGKNASAAKINETIYKLCDQLPGAAKTFCILVAPTVVKEVESGVDPQKACTQLKLCTSTEMVKEVNDIKCEICELIIQGLDELVGKNASAAKINETIYKLCDQLPGAAKTFCILVAPTVIKEVESGVDPQKACTQLKLCTSIEQSTRKADTNLNVGDIKCEICELLIHKLDGLIGKNASDEKINATIYQICNDLAGSAKTFCLLVAPTVVKEVENGADPNEACKKLKLCPGQEISKEVNDIKCEICELIIQGLDDMVGKNASAAKINETIYNLCSKLPGASKTFCILVAPTVVKEIESGVDPQKACTQLKLCTGSESRNKVELAAKMDCAACSKSLQPLYDDFSDNYMKVQRAFVKVCSEMPVMFRKSCLTLVQSDNGRYFKQFMSKYTPKALCKMANCSEKKKNGS